MRVYVRNLGGTPIIIDIREELTANRTYYVRTDGSDANTGLVNDAGGAFLTIQKAIDVAVALDLSIYAVTIQIQNATWTVGLILKSYVGVGPITILGDSAVPAAGNYLISTTAANAVSSNGVLGVWVLSGLELRSSGGSGLVATVGSHVSIKNMRFGATAVAAIQIQGAGSIVTNLQPDGSSAAAFAISGNMAYFWNLDQMAEANMVLATVTLTGTPAFSSAFIDAGQGSGAYLVSNTYNGAATGKRYNVTFNSWVQTFGATLPGNVAGTTATGGLFA